MTNEHIFTVTELSEYIKTIIPGNKIKVQGEVSQPKLSGGHLYFSLKDDNSNIKSIVWRSKNKYIIEQGQKIVMDCRLDYYSMGGNINLIVDNITTNDEKGELYIKYEKIKEDFINKGYFNQTNKNIELPPIIKNIIIITSANGAALQDFLYNMGNNNMNVNYEVIDVVVQGLSCPKNICIELEKLDKIYDLVIITRGGGSFEDLFGFSQPELIETVHQLRFKIPPILSAIGHMVDNPLLDLVADFSAPTPSLAAQFIVDHNKKYINSLQSIKNNIRISMLDQLNLYNNILTKFNMRLNNVFSQFINLKNSCKNDIINILNNRLLQLKVMESQLNTKPQDITLFRRNIKINNPDELSMNMVLLLKWGDKEFNVKILP